MSVDYLPIIAPPVDRRAVVQPHRSIVLSHGDPEADLRSRLVLLHSMNPGDPAYFRANDFFENLLSR